MKRPVALVLFAGYMALRIAVEVYWGSPSAIVSQIRGRLRKLPAE